MSHHELAAEQEHEEAANDRSLFGFWVYLMTDLLMFAVLFAVYAVLRNNTAGGPSGRDLFNPTLVLVSTILLLVSSFTVGVGMIAARDGLKNKALKWLGITFLLGLAFTAVTTFEFYEFIHEGYTWRTSAFLSAFFILVGTHALHIVCGLIWLGTTMIYTVKRGLTKPILRKLTMLSLFWHFLDIVWIFIFSVVYLMAFV